MTIQTNDYVQVQEGERGNVLGRFLLKSKGMQALAESDTFPPPETIMLVQLVDKPEMLHLVLPEHLDEIAEFYGDTNIELSVTPLARISHSKMTDEEAAGSTFVARGALYFPADE